MRFEAWHIHYDIERLIECRAIPFKGEFTRGIGICETKRLTSFGFEPHLSNSRIESMWSRNDSSTDAQGLSLVRARCARLPRLRLSRGLCGCLTALGCL